MHDEQCAPQRANALLQVGGADVLDEVPLEGERLAADQEGGLAVGFDALHQCVVVVLHVRRVVGSADADQSCDARTLVGGGDHRRAAEGVPDEQSSPRGPTRS